MSAAITLLRSVGADVAAAAAIIELSFLGGRARLDAPLTAILSYES
jgi:adenine phosphoribosyltransferase